MHMLYPDEAGQNLMEMVTDRLVFSARTYTRLLRVAHTIANLDGCEQIQQSHLAEAIQYRRLDRRTTLTIGPTTHKIRGDLGFAGTKPIGNSKA